ncbi:hypothetical protein ACOMHN_008410 [Nucella lapillus]
MWGAAGPSQQDTAEGLSVSRAWLSPSPSPKHHGTDTLTCRPTPTWVCTNPPDSSRTGALPTWVCTTNPNQGGGSLPMTTWVCTSANQGGESSGVPHWMCAEPQQDDDSIAYTVNL